MTEQSAREPRNTNISADQAESRLFLDLAEQSLAGVYLVQDGLFRYVNPRLAEIFGYTPEEMIGRLGPKQIAHENDWPIVAENIRRRLAGEIESVHYEFKGVSKTGNIIDIEVFGSSTTYNGKPAIIGTLLDISERKRMESSIKANEEKYRLLSESVSDVVYLFDTDLKIIYVSPSIEGFLGYKPSELVGRSLKQFRPLTRESARRAVSEIKRILKGDKVKTKVLTFIAKDGTHRIGEGSGAPYEMDGKVVGIVGVIRDITRRVQLEDDLRKSAKIFAAASQLARLGSWEWDMRERKMYWSDETYRIFGFEPRNESVSYRTFLKSVHKDDRSLLGKAIRRAIREGKLNRQEFRIVLPDGSERVLCMDAEAKFIRSKRTICMTGMIQDITEHKRTEERLEHLAHIDAVTNLPNRALFLDRLEQAIAQAKRWSQKFAILFLDLDRFKMINDTLGHDMGDAVLETVARRLEGSVRGMDTVARYAGDEYILILMDIEEAQSAAFVAQKILDAIARPFTLNGHHYYLGASIGISIYPVDGKTAKTLVKHADAALYLAKEKGRNRYEFYTRKLGRAVQQRLALESRLREAIRNDEFVLHYQPQIDLASGHLIGLEALLRWQPPGMGELPPQKFIGLAEETGLIRQINKWVVHHACDQIRNWLDAGLKAVPVAVNMTILSSPQLSLAEGPLSIASSILKKTGLDHGLLEFEITETSIMEHVEQYLPELKGLHEKGVSICIDDFGTGFSCLSHLKRLPVNTLKIDQAFIRHLPGDPDDAALCTAIIRMAHTMNIRVIAEGIETREQLEFLRKQRCDGGQGYLFCHPLPAGDMGPILGKDGIPDRWASLF
jgi:diguanylate cyclase (GGDEF)-like protein/PAS domain S-box-containing protein